MKWHSESVKSISATFRCECASETIRLNYFAVQLLIEFSCSTSDRFVLISTHRQYCSAVPIAAPRRLAPRLVQAGATHYWTGVRRAATFVPWGARAYSDMSRPSVRPSVQSTQFLTYLVLINTATSRTETSILGKLSTRKSYSVTGQHLQYNSEWLTAASVLK